MISLNRAGASAAPRISLEAPQPGEQPAAKVQRGRIATSTGPLLNLARAPQRPERRWRDRALLVIAPASESPQRLRKSVRTKIHSECTLVPQQRAEAALLPVVRSRQRTVEMTFPVGLSGVRRRVHCNDRRVGAPSDARRRQGHANRISESGTAPRVPGNTRSALPFLVVARSRPTDEPQPSKLAQRPHRPPRRSRRPPPTRPFPCVPDPTNNWERSLRCPELS